MERDRWERGIERWREMGEKDDTDRGMVLITNKRKEGG